MMNRIVKRILSLVLVFAMLIGCYVAPIDGRAAVKAKLVTKNIVIEKGKTSSIKIKNKKSKCKYSFTSSNKKVAKVTSKGAVKGVKKGNAKVTVKEVVKATKKSRKLGVVKVVVKNLDVSKDDKTTNSPVSTSTANTAAPITTTKTPSTVYTEQPIQSVGPSKNPATEAPAVNVKYDFADGNMSQFSAYGDGVKIEIDKSGYDDDASLKATGRKVDQNQWGWISNSYGIALDVSKALYAGNTYAVSCYVKCAQAGTMSLKSLNSTGQWSFPNKIGDSVEVKAGEWTELKAIYCAPDTITGKISLIWDSSNAADIYVDNIVIKSEKVLDDTFKTLFTQIFGKVGTCNTYTDMKDNKTFTSTLYNSVTMENETKPDSLLGNAQISTTLPEGYILPESYKDKTYPVINFSTLDNVIESAYEYGLSIRFHVFVWHTQTPQYFFKANYNENSGYVSKEIMNGRLEYYIKNVINHIYNTKHGKDVVYCFDVANEYFHNYDNNSKSNWNKIYYPEETSEENRTNKPEYIKTAFEAAYDQLDSVGLAGKVKLFYNDYNTYEVYKDIITMINYVNQERKICDGVGMQSHLAVNYPKPGMDGQIAETIDAFTAQGYEIQITELDVTTDESDFTSQENYYTELFKMLVSKKMAGSNITGVTFWGLCDSKSWRSSGKPLLFSSIFSPKASFYKVIDIAKQTWAAK